MTLEEFAKAINMNVEELVNLKVLYCYNTQVTSIPPELVNLTELYCHDTQVTSIPPELVNLKVLYCYNTQVTSIPPELVNLKVLYCDPLYTPHRLKEQRIYGFKYSEAFTRIGIPVNYDEHEIIKCAYAIISVLDKEDALKYFMSGKDYEFIKMKLGLLNKSFR